MGDKARLRDVPFWADEDLSRQSRALRSRGEGQHTEYMRSFPQQVRELAKEIAAFASSGGGWILIGVEDDGGFCGLPRMDDSIERDNLVKRVEGICRGTVKPSITPRIAFVWELGQAFLAISVPKGGQPVYYCEGRPYIRHIRESRPAEPNEVIELVQKWAGFDAAPLTGVEISSESIWLSGLASILVEILIAADEFPARSMAPWVDYLQSDCERWAESLRDLVHEHLQGKDHLSAEIRALEAQCDELASILRVRSTSTWPQLEERMPKLGASAAAMKTRLVDVVPFSDASQREATSTIVLSARKARDLVSRIDRLAGFRSDDLKDEASDIGERILRVSMYSLPFLSSEDATALRKAGRDLHLVETVQLYLDGGASLKGLADQIVAATERIESVAAKLDHP